MKDTLAQLHKETYDMVASEYEGRVEILRATTQKALQDFVDLLDDGAKVLDVGCAVGYTTDILRKAGLQADGIDIAPNMIEYATKRNTTGEFVVGDFLEVDYPLGHYDGVLMYAFLHLFPKDIAIQVLDKAIAITKPGGLIFTGTTKSPEPSEGFEVKQDYANTVQRYRKRWTQAELEEVFVSRGLMVANYAEKVDEFGKIWMDYIMRTPKND